MGQVRRRESVTKGLHITARGDYPVPVARAVRHHGHGCAASAPTDGWTRTFKLGIAEGEYATVTAHHEVSAAIRRGHHADDGCIQAMQVTPTRPGRDPRPGIDP